MLRGFLTPAGIANDQYVFYDGSGCAAKLVTPHAIVPIVALRVTAAVGRAYKSSLPVAGVDGSLSERLKDARLEKRVLAKTGSLGGVKKAFPVRDTDSARRSLFHSYRQSESSPSRVTDTNR